jgi:hypothetical protein
MAYEIFGEDTVTPHRLHTLLRLVARLEKATRKDLLNLLQPSEIGLSKQETSSNVLKAARNLSLIIENEDKTISLTMAKEQIETVEAYKNYLRNAFLGKTIEEHPNYLLNLFIAWYAVQNEKVFSNYRTDRDYAAEINRQLFPNVTPQRYDEKVIIGNARDWSAFLGLGWMMRYDRPGSGRIIFVPDATERLEALLPDLLPLGSQMRFVDFLRRLAEHCPELDGGKLFNYCWEICNKGQPHGNNLSLILSNGLRGLRDLDKIELVRQADATENWQLYPAYGDRNNEVTHIRRGEN